MHLRKNGWEGLNEKHKGTNFWKLQRKNPTSKSNDGNWRTKRNEHFVDKKEAGVDSPDKKEWKLGIKSARSIGNKVAIEIDINIEAKYKQK